MTSATDTDIREIKTSIDKLADRVESIVKATEANTKAIADLNTSVTGIREEMWVGFTKLEGKIDTVDVKYDERTKLGFWGFIFRGTALAALAAMTAIFLKYLFPILPVPPSL